MLRVFALIALTSVWVSATLTNITVTDNAPTIKYTPSRSGNAQQTWNVTHSGNAWATTSPGNLSIGTSMHWTTYIGATATFGFKGTGIYINGTGSTGDVTVTVGGEDITQTGSGSEYMALKDGMTDQWWDVVVKVTGGGGVFLEGITFTVDIGNDGSVISPRKKFNSTYLQRLSINKNYTRIERTERSESRSQLLRSESMGQSNSCRE